jgi:hypothetical protein
MDMDQRRFYVGFGDTVGVMATSYAEAVKIARQTFHVDGMAVTLNWDAHTVEVEAALTPARADAWAEVLREAKAELWRERVREYKSRRDARKASS